MKLDYDYFVMVCAKKDNTGQLSRCMMCGRPFNYEGNMSRVGGYYNAFTFIPRKQPLHWNYIKGMYVCDHCIDSLDEHEIDLPVYWYERLINKYITPHEELKQLYEAR
jgi:hypothetical protein